MLSLMPLPRPIELLLVFLRAQACSPFWAFVSAVVPSWRTFPLRSLVIGLLLVLWTKTLQETFLTMLQSKMADIPESDFLLLIYYEFFSYLFASCVSLLHDPMSFVCKCFLSGYCCLSFFLSVVLRPTNTFTVKGLRQLRALCCLYSFVTHSSSPT